LEFKIWNCIIPEYRVTEQTVKFAGIDPAPNVTDACGVPTTEHTVPVAPFPDSQIFENPILAPWATPVRPFPETSAQVLELEFQDS